MPKISAPTVAEHRAAQRTALLLATRELLEAEGVAAATPAAVTRRAGLSRSSFYEYFASRDDLLVAVALQVFDEWNAEIEDALDAAEPGMGRLRAYVVTALAMTADGHHRIATVLREADLSPTSRDDMMAVHDRLTSPLVGVLDELGVADPRMVGAFVQGALASAMQLVSHGVPVQSTAAGLIAVLEHGIVRGA
ncbi:TetR/AcrR family transcriptional regulator [Agromyces binzhouensis]|uniref:TetR/AcrR family transcriptional regulator n=1 Tax=Agromyces binzhouensis TaxID=1817495 RepID=A0A4Q2JM55_9MICO|nr:TetR/AcrR family transcriptional regulator [Agromyces binzhouensis]RXZ47200.1 TetR/AcrR family transcriptional regulator [Agromyces binzhouensis]